MVVCTQGHQTRFFYECEEGKYTNRIYLPYTVYIYGWYTYRLHTHKRTWCDGLVYTQPLFIFLSQAQTARQQLQKHHVERTLHAMFEAEEAEVN